MSRTRTIKLDNEPLEVTFINPGQWFSHRWLVTVGVGFSSFDYYIVEADYEGDAIDELIDSGKCEYLKVECEDPTGECESCMFGGNYGEHIDLDGVTISELTKAR